MKRVGKAGIAVAFALAGAFLLPASPAIAQEEPPSLTEGLVDLEAAVDLETAIGPNVLGINLNVPLGLSLLLN